MKLRQAVITVLESEVNELLAQMAAIGAGGVSQGTPLDVRERLMPYLRACEHAWWQVQKEGTPENNRAFDDARVKFWEVAMTSTPRPTGAEIAAAPDLLEALQAVVGAAGPDSGPEIGMAEAAIKKATGAKP